MQPTTPHPRRKRIILPLFLLLALTCPPAQAIAAAPGRLPAQVEAVIKAYGGAQAIKEHTLAPLHMFAVVGSTSGISAAANDYDCHVFQRDHKLRVEMMLLGTPLINGYDGSKSWSQFGGWVTPGTASATETVASDLRHGLPALAELLDAGTKVEMLPAQTLHGKKCDVFRATTADGKSDTFLADAETHLILRSEYMGTDHELGNKALQAIEYFDYRPLAGSLEPYRLVQFSGERQKGTTLVKLIDVDPKMGDETFSMPPESEVSRLKDGPISMPFDYAGNTILIKAKINNGPEQDFIVDTGASQTVLDTATAAALGPQSASRFSITAGSRAVPLSFLTIPALNISGIAIEDLPALVTDLSGMAGHPAGILGASVLKRFALTIDFEEKKLTLSDPRTVTLPPGSTVVPGTPVFGGTAMMIKGRLDDKPVSFLVDTGASFNNLPAALAKPLYSGSVLSLGEIFGIDGQHVNIGSVKFKSLQLGTLTIPHPVFTLAPEGISPSGGLFTANGMGILGNPVWSQFRTTIDYRNERLILESEPGREKYNRILLDLEQVNQEYLRSKDIEQALKGYEKIAAAARSADQKAGEALATARIASLHADKYLATRDGQWLDTSGREFDLANKLANESRNRSVEGLVLGQWALTYLTSPRSAQDIAAAQTLLTKALQKAPMEPNIFAAFGTALLQQGKRPEAEKLLDRALLLDPSNWQALWAKYKLYGEDNRNRDRNLIAAQLRHYYPTYPDVTALGR